MDHRADAAGTTPFVSKLQEKAMSTHIAVLIVGGGLNGLTAAALLARQDIDCMVIERHADTSI